MKAMEIMLYVIGGLTLVLGLMLFLAWILMLVWNFLAGYFGFKIITFWVAVAITVFLSIVGSFFKSSGK